MKPTVLPIVALVLGGALLAGLAGCGKPGSERAAAPATKAAPVDTKVRVSFELVAEVVVAALQIDVEYAGASGRFDGEGDAVACQNKIDGALSSFNHLAESKTLRAAFVALNGFQGPVRFLECDYTGGGEPEDFLVVVRDASAPDLNEVTPPEIKVVVEPR